MAADTEDKSAREVSGDDMNHSFAWGQLFVGSILAGFSVYQLALKAMRMPPSEMLAGFVATYEAVRDFLMLPFSWIDLIPTELEKNYLLISAVMVGALIRAAVRYPRNFLDHIGSLALGWIAFESLFLFYRIDISALVPVIARITGFIFIGSVLLPVFFFVAGRLGSGERGMPLDARQYALILLNIFFTLGWGTFLLLLNWATL